MCCKASLSTMKSAIEIVCIIIINNFIKLITDGKNCGKRLSQVPRTRGVLFIMLKQHMLYIGEAGAKLIKVISLSNKLSAPAISKRVCGITKKVSISYPLTRWRHHQVAWRSCSARLHRSCTR